MTVLQLINALKEMPESAIVFSEGCDCNSRVNGVVNEEDSGTVLLERE